MTGPINHKQYEAEGIKVIPCLPGQKRPKDLGWDKEEYTGVFGSEDNNGIRLDELVDIDIDNKLAKTFYAYLVQPSSAIYGRESNRASHRLYKANDKVIHKKFSLPKAFDKLTKDFPHGNCLIEVRHGRNKQSVGPGSIVEGELVKWNTYDKISPYPGNINEDVSKVALATALQICGPKGTGSRSDFLFTIACILTRVKWKEEQINDFVYTLCKVMYGTEKKPNTLSRLGTRAFKQLAKQGRMMGFVRLKDITGLDVNGLYEIFSWVGLERKADETKTIELVEKYYYLQNTGLMFDDQTGVEYKKDLFNFNNLYDFPGGKNKKKAFEHLLTDPEFQDRKLISKQFLPDYPYPIAEIKHHVLLEPGRYYNLWRGFDSEPIERDTVKWEDDDGNEHELDVKQEIAFVNRHYERLFGKEEWHQIRMYIAYCIQNPGVKIRWIPLIISPEGIGKGALLRLIANIMGQRYVNENVSFADITEKHSTIVVGSLFCALNEVSIDGGQYTTKRTVSAKIKPFISDDFLNINEKGKPIYKYLNNCNAMAFSNDEDCLHIDTSSRRYLVIVVKTSVKEIEKMTDNGDFKRLWNATDKLRDDLHNYFLNIEIDDEDQYQKRAPKTKSLLGMIEDSKHDLVGDLDSCLQDREPPFDDRHFKGFISLNQLLYFIRVNWKIHASRKVVKRWLKENGKEWEPGKLTRQIVMKDSRPRVYWLDDEGIRKNLPNLTEGQLGELADTYTPTDYLEHQKLDYRMLKNTKSYDDMTEEQRDQSEINKVRRATPYLAKLDFKLLEQIYQMRKDTYDGVNTSNKTPIEDIQQMNNVKHEVFKRIDKWIKEIQKKSEGNY